MIGSLLRELHRLEIPCEHDSRRGTLLFHVGGGVQEFLLSPTSRTPRPSEVSPLDHEYPQQIILAPFIGAKTAIALQEKGWSWADTCGNWFIRGEGLLLQSRAKTKPPKQTERRVSLPVRGQGLAVIRRLIELTENISPTAIARDLEVSQPFVSQILSRLVKHEFADKSAWGRWDIHKEALLDWFLETYPGPGGEVSYAYTLAPLAEVADTLMLNDFDQALSFSSDLAAERFAPSRTPTHLIVYAPAGYRPSDWTAVPAAGWGDANVAFIEPRDESVHTPPLQPDVQDFADRYQIAHPTQLIWDLRFLGGSDRIAQAEEVRQWLLHQ